MQVLTNKKGMLDCSLIKENKHTIWVKLIECGNIIKRNKKKHKIVK